MTVNIEYFDYMNAMEKMCDNFCQYPNKVKDQDSLNRICEECPMNKLVKLNNNEDQEG